MFIAGTLGLNKKLIKEGAMATGKVTRQSTLYWIKINTKSVRLGPGDGAISLVLSILPIMWME